MLNLLNICVLFLATVALGVDVGPAARECRDTFHSCSSWSKAGICDNEKFGFVMRGGCAKTCGFCTGKESIPKKKLKLSTPEIHTAVVQDDNKKNTKTEATHDKDVAQQKEKSPKLDATTTPTPHTIITTVTTATTPTTATTATTATPANDIVIDVDKPAENADHPGYGNCIDIFERCKIWNEDASICDRPAFKMYMKYGCKKTCGVCGPSNQRKAVIETAPNSLSNAAKKSLLEIWPKIDNDEANDELMHAVEVGISREMSEELISKASKRSKVMHKGVSSKKFSKRSKTHKKFKSIHGVKRKHKEKRSKVRRVEIETGYKNPRPFASFEEGEPFSSPDQQNSKAVNTFGRALNSAEGFDSLAKLPDFDGISDVSDVQKLLETPKPNKKLDYYVDHFSNDPYVAYSEKQDWMKENDIHLKKYRRRLQKASKKSNSKKRHKQSKKLKRDLKTQLHSTSKKLVIENGSEVDPSPFAAAEELTNGIDKLNLQMAGANSIFPDSQSLKPDFVSHLRELPYFEGPNKDDAEKTLAKAKLGKNFDYYVENFSKDPYLAESERQQWMKNNEVREKSYRRKNIEGIGKGKSKF